MGMCRKIHSYFYILETPDRIVITFSNKVLPFNYSRE